MKRLLLPALVALGLFSSLAASADVTMYRKNLPFDIRRSAVNSNEWDSLIVHRGGSRTDTTATFRLSGWARQGTIADSTLFLAIEFGAIPGSSITVASSTTNFALQMSTDGNNWTTVGAEVDPFDGSPNLTATNTGSYVREVPYLGTPAMRQALHASYLRFIVVSAATGQQTLWVSWPRALVAGTTKWAGNQ
jgi:hypothetical protein